VVHVTITSLFTIFCLPRARIILRLTDHITIFTFTVFTVVLENVIRVVCLVVVDTWTFCYFASLHSDQMVFLTAISNLTSCSCPVSVAACLRTLAPFLPLGLFTTAWFYEAIVSIFGTLTISTWANIFLVINRFLFSEVVITWAPVL